MPAAPAPQSGGGGGNAFNVDPSLVQNAFLGPNLGMDAVQASWIAPLPVYVELGAEGGKPVDFPSATSDHNQNGISGGTLFAHLGDLGDSSSYRVGSWYCSPAIAKPRPLC